jgi:hypothetical protein
VSGGPGVDQTEPRGKEIATPTKEKRSARSFVIIGAVAVVAVTSLILTTNVDDSAKIAASAGTAIGIATLVLELLNRRGRHDARDAGSPADDLAKRLDQQWKDEARSRGLHDDRILPLSWSNSAISGNARADATRPAPSFRSRIDSSIPDAPAAAAKSLAESYASLRLGRGWILGEPGSGKTVLALLLCLGCSAPASPAARCPSC